MLMDYASVAAFFLVAVGFIVASLLVGKLVRPSHLYPKKLETYECGEPPVGIAWFNFNPRFYIVALVYIVFDVEIALIYPVATVYRRWVVQGLGVFALSEIVVFAGILLLGLVYAWRKGDLEWIRAVGGGPRGAANVSSRARRPEKDEHPVSEPIAAMVRAAREGAHG
jgi:NADH-quinone oxidoreductase subunit A